MVLESALGERDDGKWSAFEVGLVVGRQQGKGGVLEIRVLGGLFCFEEELVLWSAHEYRTAMEMFRRFRVLIRRMGRRINENIYDVGDIRVKIVNTNGDEGFERLDTGQRIQFIARSKNAGRGFTADCLIWDEAYALTEDQVDAQMPTLLARPNPQIWYTSSPPLDAVSGAQLFQVRKRALNGEAGLAYFEWGAEGCLDDLSQINLDDRQLWASVLPAYGDRVSDEGVQRLRNAMSDVGFAREVLCIWPPDLTGGFAVINEADWAAACDERSQLTGRPAFAVDVSPDRGRAAIGVAGRRRDGLVHVELVDARPGTGWVVPRLVELVARWRPVAVVIDRAGPAGSLIAAATEAHLEVTEMTAADAARAFGQFYDGVSGADLAGRVVRHLGQPELTAAVAGATKRPLGEGAAWNRRNTTIDLTPLVACTNAAWGFAVKGTVAAFNAGVARL